MSSEIQNLHNKLKSIHDKDLQRKEAKVLANQWVRENAIGTTDVNKIMYLRHCFVYLPVEDISNYISYIGLSSKKNKHEIWIGEPPLWASLCRMLRARHDNDVFNKLWSLEYKDLKNVNYQVITGLYAHVFDHELFDTWKKIISQKPENHWTLLSLYIDIDKIPDDAKLKIFTVLSTLNDSSLLNNASTFLKIEKTWQLIEGFYHNEWFDHDIKHRHAQLIELSKQKPMPNINNIDLGQFNLV